MSDENTPSVSDVLGLGLSILRILPSEVVSYVAHEIEHEVGEAAVAVWHHMLTAPHEHGPSSIDEIRAKAAAYVDAINAGRAPDAPRVGPYVR